MSLLETLHRRIDRLTPEQQKSLKLWLDFQERRYRSKNGAITELRDDPEQIALGEGGVKLAAMVWPREDFSDWPGYYKSARRKKAK
jgi:hypothetical protein